MAENGMGDKEKALEEFSKITGKKRDETEFTEYWG